MTNENNGENAQEVSQGEIQAGAPTQEATAPVIQEPSSQVEELSMKSGEADAAVCETSSQAEESLPGVVQDVAPAEAPQTSTLSDAQKVGLLEALLLASGDPLPIARVQDILQCSKADVLQLVESLKKAYAEESCGLELVLVAQKLQLRTKALYAEHVRQLIAVKPRKLSQAALETLAVIAYQQPVVKSEVDKIRGVDVAPTIKTLLERKLIKILGYQASVGQPALYGTTEDFLSIFGLNTLSELPALRDLKALVKEPGEALESQDDSPNDDDSGDEDMAETGALTEQSAEVESQPQVQ
jgi:segregation and condensation protein B